MLALFLGCLPQHYSATQRCGSMLITSYQYSLNIINDKKTWYTTQHYSVPNLLDQLHLKIDEQKLKLSTITIICNKIDISFDLCTHFATYSRKRMYFLTCIHCHYPRLQSVFVFLATIYYHIVEQFTKDSDSHYVFKSVLLQDLSAHSSSLF